MESRDKIQHSKLRSTLLAIACMLVVIILIFSLKSYPDFIEQYYSNGLYVLIRTGFQFLFNHVPFSVGDVFYIIIVVLLFIGVFQIIRLLIRKQLNEAGLLLLRLVLKTEIAIAAFYILWALNYFRQPASERLELQNYEYDVAQLVTVTSILIDSANVSRSYLQSSDFDISRQEISEAARTSILSLSSFDPPMVAIKPMPKVSLLSPLLNYLGTAGYYNPFTGEAQYNSLMPVYTQPFVACHEMAHQMGFGAEDEANFAGFIAGKSSNNKLLKYSAYYLAAQEFMNEVWRTDSTAFKKMREKISPAVIEDLENERQYWIQYQGSAARLSSVFYDNYLKANKQPGGLTTYNKMIKLSMAHYRKNGLFK
ncbi:MAG: DUF3810 domain-containing protein [Bacteroidota bacterium]